MRASGDRGATWSPPTAILSPNAGTPWACAATDGDAAYDPRTATWLYLFQCRTPTSDWSGCVAERRDESPLGGFTAPAPDTNPVITPGQLWESICDAGDRCAQVPGRPPGTSILAALTPGNRRPFPLTALAWLPGWRRNVWLTATAPAPGAGAPPER